MRYYGCKTKLLDYIEEVVQSLQLKPGAVFFDIFSGTSAVGKHFKKLNYTVYSNDFLEFAYAMGYCYIQTNSNPKFKKLTKNLKLKNPNEIIDYLNQLKGKAGFITKNYSPYQKNKRQYLSVENAKKVDVIRETIEKWKKENLINKSEYYYLIVSLIEGINLVSNVTGTYAAFLKDWDNRALKKMLLTPPEIIRSKRKNRVFKENANDIVSKYNADILYLDPPYNSRQFASNYFFLELITEGWINKKPEIYGQSGMRPYEHQKSKYSMKYKATNALKDLVNKAKAKYIIMSYNNEGIIPLDEIEKILKKRGNLRIFTKEHKRYRAINQDGTKTKTKEVLFLLKTK